MATLQKIRNRAGWILVAFIGLAMLLFVVDLNSLSYWLKQNFNIGSGGTRYVSPTDEIAEIDGKSVSYEEYTTQVEQLAEFYTVRYGLTSLDQQMIDGVREEAWENMVRNYTLMDEYRQLGISVSPDELMDMVQGRNPHPIIRQMFSDPETGIVNRTFLLQFIQTMDQDPSGAQRTIWMHLESQILNERNFSKFNNLVRQGLYITDLEAENGFREADKRVDFSYIVKRFNTIHDTAITYTDADIEKYYKEHMQDYSQTASRDLEYVVFEVLPSAEDDRMARDWINRIKGEFESDEDVLLLVNMESDVPFQDRFFMEEELSDTIRDFAFNADVDDVFGPYIEEESYRLARLVEIDYRPDSVTARHILLQPDQNTTMDQLKDFADSLKQMIDNGADFAQLATVHSADRSAQNGGDLGIFAEGQMVTPFSNACFEGEKGDVVVVETQFGQHIIEILDQGPVVKKVKIAIMSRKVEPSTGTFQEKYSAAIEFSGKNRTYEQFNNAISDQGLTKRYANDLTELQRTLPGLESPREMIRWAFESSLHNVSDVFEFNNKYVVACITNVREEGSPPLEEIRNEIELEVKINKKAEKITEELSEKIETANSLNDLALKVNLPVQDARGVSFSSLSVPSLGMEPKVIGAISKLPEGVVSQPIQGNNGVFVVVVNNIEQSETSNAQFTKDRLTMMRQSRANAEVYQALRKAANISDKRGRFF
jgi:peptidyl-prolyl cis-trans isomerase D